MIGRVIKNFCQKVMKISCPGLFGQAMLLSEKDPDASIRSFHAWSPEFCERFLGALGSFGFHRDEDTIVAPSSADWTIRRTRGKAFVYQKRGEPDLYNPIFTILFRGRLVVSIHTTVYLYSTTYASKWNDDMIPRILDYMSMREIDEKFPEFVPSILEQFLIGS
jgi:hypothetical protein